MEESFSLSVSYKGQEIELPGILRVSRYTQQFIFDVSGTQLIVEKDDELNLRAILPDEEIKKGSKIDSRLVEMIVAELAKVLE